MPDLCFVQSNKNQKNKVMKTQQTFKTKLFYLLTILGIVMLASCEEQYGCTDMNAINYDPYADVSDGSCYYLPTTPDPTPIPPPVQNPVGLKVTKIELLNISLCNGPNSYWDGSQWDKPDVRITLFQNNTSAFYVSPIAHNVTSYTFNNINLTLSNLQTPLSLKIEELDIIGAVTVMPIAVMINYDYAISSWSYSSSIAEISYLTANLCAGNTANMKVRLHYTWIY